ncbi:transglutaminaseTgpA domain-containing protein [Actinomadura flavalba]|uniref:transglutaminase family protein n=1 Tax=Actinomadura flavalba TaxID=1120938 RepID=UPI0012DCAB25|nr:DUF3488 and transglutaminase-like domain-containing protein [Actinomadura flavalba]
MRPQMTIMAVLATLAGTAGLYPLFTSRSWFWYGLGAVLCVAAGSAAVRYFRLPAVVGVAGGLGALLLYLTVLFTPGQALLGVVPTPGSLRALGAVANAGWQGVNQYAAPVPPVKGILMLTAAGVGLVAVLVDLLAVWLRRAAPAGLPLLAMYSVPAAVRDDSVSWLAFGVGALGYLMLLTSDAREQVGGWGRAVEPARRTEDVPYAGETADAAPRVRSAALAASGRRIGAGAVAVALVVPLVVPGLRPGGWFGLGDGDGNGGSRTVTTPDPLVSLKRELTRQDDSVVLTYRTREEDPDYLRLYALDRFDGDRWTYNALESTGRDRLTSGRLPAPPGLADGVPTRDVRTVVDVRPEVRRMTFLPVPYAPTRVSVKGEWRVHPPSLMVYSLRDSAGGRSYTVDSRRALPTARDLAGGGSSPPDVVAHYTSYPRSVPPAVRRLADQVTRGATSAYAQAVALQRWFTETGGFVYDLSAPSPQHGSDLVAFLLNSKRGYCEQFAASMALMARILGIPARVAMGYTAGTRTTGDRWTVRSRDAHAWPELYFPGTGWVRFEPTPAGATGQGTAVTPPYSTQAQAQAPETPETRGGEDDPAAEEEAEASPSAAPAQRDDLPGDTSAPETREDGAPYGWMLAGALVVLLLAAPMVARALLRRRRWAAVDPSSSGSGGPRSRRTAAEPVPADAAHAAWREMRADALDHGLAWPSSDTPRAAARRLTESLHLDEASAQALGRIAMAEERARYARAAVRVPPSVLRGDVHTVRAAFSQNVTRRARWRARLLPPTTVTATTSAARAYGDRAADAAARAREAITARVTALRDRD